LAAFVVVVVIVSIASVGSLLIRNAVRSEEHRLLQERASEIGLILTEAFSGLQTQMATVAGETQLNGADARAFMASTATLITAQPGSSTVLADAGTDPVRFVAVIGTALPPTAVGPADALIRRALNLRAEITTSVFDEGSAHVIGLAYPVGVGGLVIYRQLPLDPSAAGSATSGSQPFHELTVALYAGPTQEKATLILTTSGQVPLRGSVAVASTTFGADQWLVAINATSPLVGNFATNAFWLVLVGGVVVALALGALADSLLRRREHTLTLVDQRTAELRDSMAKLELAQEQVLRQARLAAIGELAAGVGHELRNPLGVITNAHYLLRAGFEQQGGNGLMRHLALAEREVGAATLIVGDLLDFAGPREPVTTPVGLHELLDEVLDLAAPPSGITVDRDESAGCSPVLADRDQLRQVLLNLITNAYEAMPGGGAVTVVVREAPGGVELQVTDSGVGMDQETAAQVFQPFFTRKARGIGLGLAVTKRIIDAHGGGISVTSAPGVGTTFRVDLPAAVVGAAP
jgi:signal transduction histidine kinase